MCGGVVLLGVVTVATFARERYGVSIVDRAFGVRRDILRGYYQDDLYSVSLKFFCAAVGFARMVDVTEDVAVSPCVQYVVLVVDEVIGNFVFVWAVLSEVVLTFVMHGIRHYVSSVLSDYCSFRDRHDCSESDAGVIGRLKSGHISFGVYRCTSFFVPAKRVYAIISVAYDSRGVMIA